MKKLLFGLLSVVAFVGLTGCAEDVVYADPNYPVVSGCVTYCDDYGCREVCGPYYHDSAGVLFYWDAHFGCWIGPHGYWRGGVFYHGYHPGYHGYYHGGGYHGSGRYHGGYHGGGGHHR